MDLLKLLIFHLTHLSNYLNQNRWNSSQNTKAQAEDAWALKVCAALTTDRLIRRKEFLWSKDFDAPTLKGLIMNNEMFSILSSKIVANDTPINQA